MRLAYRVWLDPGCVGIAMVGGHFDPGVMVMRSVNLLDMAAEATTTILCLPTGVY